MYQLCKIGNNFNLSPGVMLGKFNRGKNMVYPKIGDNVYIGSEAKVIGAVRREKFLALKRFQGTIKGSYKRMKQGFSAEKSIYEKQQAFTDFYSHSDH